MTLACGMTACSRRGRTSERCWSRVLLSAAARRHSECVDDWSVLRCARRGRRALLRRDQHGHELESASGGPVLQSANVRLGVPFDDVDANECDCGIGYATGRVVVCVATGVDGRHLPLRDVFLTGWQRHGGGNTCNGVELDGRHASDKLELWQSKLRLVVSRRAEVRSDSFRKSMCVCVCVCV